MLPCVLLAAAFGVPQDPAADVLRRTVYRLEHPTSPWRATGGTSAVPVQYAVHVWGDPQHLRNYPWGGVNPLMPKVVGVPANPFAMPEKPQRPQPAPVPPPDPTAERIKAIETVILDLKARGGSAAVIEQLQHDLDELKAKKK